jgi:hypothetical protein
MKRVIIASVMFGLSATAALAQANPSAPQPSETGVGVVQPGITGTGTAVDGTPVAPPVVVVPRMNDEAGMTTGSARLAPAPMGDRVPNAIGSPPDAEEAAPVGR